MFLTYFHVTGVNKFLYLVLDIASLLGTQELLEKGHKLESFYLFKRCTGFPKIESIIVYSFNGK